MVQILYSTIKRLVRHGDLTMIDPHGQEHRMGDGKGTRVVARVTDRRTERALVIDPDLAFGEAWMNGTLRVEEGSLADLLEILMRAGEPKNFVFGKAMFLARYAIRRFRQRNNALKAKRNVAHHYDLSGKLYDLFLDADRHYSCAYFERPEMSIDEAQAAKKRHIAAKLLLAPGQHILDIGSGWGGLGLYLTRMGEAGSVMGVTLSEEQHALSNARAREAGLADRLSFELMDYRAIDRTFDRIVSVGMFEHVGVVHYDDYFAKVRALLKDDGVMLLHSIGRADGPGITNRWTEKYIFPGGYIPALSEVLPAIERQGLHVTDIEILRMHYAETLKAWRERFLARREEALALYDERFCRMWEFYLAGSEMAFRYQGLMVFQIQLSPDPNAVPLTRDYIGKAEKALKRKEQELGIDKAAAE